MGGVYRVPTHAWWGGGATHHVTFGHAHLTVVAECVGVAGVRRAQVGVDQAAHQRLFHVEWGVVHHHRGARVGHQIVRMVVLQKNKLFCYCFVIVFFCNI